MKKIVLTAFSFISIILLSSCGSSMEINQKNPPGQYADKTIQPRPVESTMIGGSNSNQNAGLELNLKKKKK